jgi:2-keto-4-pentenoate hydratase/2-oxohepta-3-ene-1,7-dioic acid hydratase in catechol pathway
MKLASFRANGRTSYGAVTDGGIIDLGRKLSKYPTLLDLLRAQATAEASAAAKGQADYQIKDVEMLPPIPTPDKNICVGINYPDRNAEYKDGREAPKYPNLFCRFPTSLVGTEQPIVRPKVSDKFDYEGEIVLVIGKEGSVRDWLRHGSLNVTQGKNFDKSGSVGPWMVTADELDPAKPLRVMTRVNGEVRQDDTTDRLTWGFAWLINYISTFATLKPGDLIWTGTPTGAGVHRNPPVWLKPGDVVEVESPQIGVLRNTVADEGS